MALTKLTAKKIDGVTQSVPKRITVESENIIILGAGTYADSGGTFTKLREQVGGFSHSYEVFETPEQITACSILTSSDIRSKNHVALAASAAGTTQAAGTLLAKLVTELTTVTDASAEGVRLPLNPSVGAKHTVINNGAGTAKVYPGVGDFIKESGVLKAVNVHSTIATGAEKTFVCLAADTWTVCS